MRNRPNPTEGKTYKLSDGIKKIYLTINYFTDKLGNKIPIEVFISCGKAGTEIRSLYDSIARLISTSMKHELNILDICKALRGVTGDVIYLNGKKFLSSVDAVARILEKEFSADKEENITLTATPKFEEDKTYLKQPNERMKYEINSISFCPDCGNTDLIPSEGCITCSSCGFSKC